MHGVTAGGQTDENRRVPRTGHKAKPSERSGQRIYSAREVVIFRHLHRHRSRRKNFELRIDECAGDSERTETGAGGADQQVFRAGAINCEARNQNITPRTHEVARRHAGEAGCVARPGVVGFHDHRARSRAGNLHGTSARNRCHEGGVQTRIRGQCERTKAKIRRRDGGVAAPVIVLRDLHRRRRGRKHGEPRIGHGAGHTKNAEARTHRAHKHLFARAGHIDANNQNLIRCECRAD